MDSVFMKGRKHRHGCTHDCLYTDSLRSQEDPLSPVWEIAVAYLKITYGEYTAQCECCTTFRNTPEGVLPKAH